MSVVFDVQPFTIRTHKARCSQSHDGVERASPNGLERQFLLLLLLLSLARQ